VIHNPRTVAIIQARMGSTRLPGKILLDLGGEPVLARVMERAKRAKRLSQVTVATSDLPADNVIAEVSHQRGWPCFRGSESDVLDRYYHAAMAFGAAVVVRITSDCPLIDSEIVDSVIGEFLKQQADYASNTLERTYPRGLDTEVFSMAALRRAWCEAQELPEREHVTPYLYGHPEQFRLASLTNGNDDHGYRWTLDTPEDLQLIRAIYQRFGNRDDFSWREALAIMEREPELAGINAHIVQKSSSSPQI
jgi:spore coat polysaccharide biosynthesis protein SpsF